MNVHISTTNTKMLCPSVSLPPRVTCCTTVCERSCYAWRIYCRRATVRNAWDENLTVYRRSEGKYFNSISTWLAAHAPRYFRWHVGGDIPDMRYFEGMCTIAKLHPDISFLCFTKYGQVSLQECPSSLKVVFSNWGTRIATTDIPQAWYQPNKGEPITVKNSKVCPGKCSTCRYCWHMKRGEHVIFKQH